MKRKITDIIIHCAATPNGKDFRAKDIDAMHQVRGFHRNSQAMRNFNPTLKAIGYHFVVDIDGTIETGRGIEEIGAHVQGSNARSIGIVLIGTNEFSPQQWLSLKNLLIDLCGRIYGKPTKTISNTLATYKQMKISIKGHRDYSPDLNGDGIIERNEWLKECPCFDVATWLKTLKD
jgi:N-acetylmuramoyl-L-alanine amidase